MTTLEKQPTIILAGGRIRCRRCNAKSKRTSLQCGAPALRTKTKCASHGGKSTGPRTEVGRQRLREANTKHGKFSKQGYTDTSQQCAQLEHIEDALYLLNMAVGPRTRGRKAKGYSKLTSPLQAQAWVVSELIGKTS